MDAKEPQMSLWSQSLREGVVAGSLGSLLSTAVLALMGYRETGSAVAPTNAVSHWLWGNESLRAQRLSLRHTATGFITHHAASILWATLYARIYGYREKAKAPPRALAGGLATSAVAYCIDYTITPKRFTPGFEHRLSKPAMTATYGAMALGFALGAMALRESRGLRAGLEWAS